MVAGPAEKLTTCDEEPIYFSGFRGQFLLRFFGLKNQERPDLQISRIKLIIKK
jgi:hypothetical protein